MSGVIDHVFAMLPSRALTDDGLTDFDIRVLSAFAAHNGEQGWVKGYTGVADALGGRKIAVRNSLVRLLERGYLEMRTNGGEANLYRTRIYPPARSEMEVGCDAH